MYDLGAAHVVVCRIAVTLQYALEASIDAWEAYVLASGHDTRPRQETRSTNPRCPIAV